MFDTILLEAAVAALPYQSADPATLAEQARTRLLDELQRRLAVQANRVEPLRAIAR